FAYDWRPVFPKQPASLLACGNSPQQVIKEVEQECHMYSVPLGFRRLWRLEHREALTIRVQRKIQSAIKDEPAVGPKPTLADNKRMAIHAVFPNHDPVVRRFVEQFVVVRPHAVESASLGNLPTVSGPCRERPNIDFIRAGLIGPIGDPSSVG